MMSLLKKLLVFVILALAPFVVSAEYNKNQEMAYLEFPPYWLASPDENGKLGIHYHLVEEVFKNAGLNVTMKATPYPRILKHVEQGKVAFINWGDDPKANQFVHLPLPGVDIIQVVASKDKEKEVPITPDGFAGKKAVTVRGWLLLGLEPLRTQDSTKMYTVTNMKSAVNMLEKDRVDYLLAYQGPLNSYKEQVKNYNIKVSAKIFGYSLAIPKSYKDADALNEVISKSFNELVEKGVIDKEKMLLVNQ